MLRTTSRPVETLAVMDDAIRPSTLLDAFASARSSRTRSFLATRSRSSPVMSVTPLPPPAAVATGSLGDVDSAVEPPKQ